MYIYIYIYWNTNNCSDMANCSRTYSSRCIRASLEENTTAAIC